MPSGNCVKCGVWRQALHRDHVIPKWKGGSNDPSNRQLLCANCHEDKTLAERKEFSEDQKQRMATSMLGRRLTPEQRARQRAGFTPEVRANLSDKAKRRKRQSHSQETRDRISAGLARFHGKKQTNGGGLWES